MESRSQEYNFANREVGKEDYNVFENYDAVNFSLKQLVQDRLESPFLHANEIIPIPIPERGAVIYQKVIALANNNWGLNYIYPNICDVFKAIFLSITGEGVDPNVAAENYYYLFQMSSYVSEVQQNEETTPTFMLIMDAIVGNIKDFVLKNKFLCSKNLLNSIMMIYSSMGLDDNLKQAYSQIYSSNPEYNKQEEEVLIEKSISKAFHEETKDQAIEQELPMSDTEKLKNQYLAGQASDKVKETIDNKKSDIVYDDTVEKTVAKIQDQTPQLIQSFNTVNNSGIDASVLMLFTNLLKNLNDQNITLILKSNQNFVDFATSAAKSQTDFTHNLINNQLEQQRLNNENNQMFANAMRDVNFASLQTNTSNFNTVVKVVEKALETTQGMTNLQADNIVNLKKVVTNLEIDNATLKKQLENEKAVDQRVIISLNNTITTIKNLFGKDATKVLQKSEDIENELSEISSLIKSAFNALNSNIEIFKNEGKGLYETLEKLKIDSSAEKSKNSELFSQIDKEINAMVDAGLFTFGAASDDTFQTAETFKRSSVTDRIKFIAGYIKRLVGTYKQKILEALNENEILKAKMNEMVNDNLLTNQVRTKIDAEYSVAKTEIIRLNSEIDRLNSEIVDNGLTIQSLKTTQTHNSNEMIAKNQEITEVKKTNDDLLSKIKVLSIEANTLADSASLLDVLKGKNANLEINALESVKKITELNEVIKKHVNEITALKNEIVSLKKQVVEREAEIKKAKTDQIELEKKLASEKAGVELSRKYIKDFYETTNKNWLENSQLKFEENPDLNEFLKKFSKDVANNIASYVKIKDKYKKEKNDAENNLKAQISQNNSLIKQNSDNTDLVARLSDENKDLKDKLFQVEVLENNVVTLNLQLTEITKENDALKSVHVVTNSEFEALKEKFEANKNKLTLIRNAMRVAEGGGGGDDPNGNNNGMDIEFDNEDNFRKVLAKINQPQSQPLNYRQIIPEVSGFKNTLNKMYLASGGGGGEPPGDDFSVQDFENDKDHNKLIVYLGTLRRNVDTYYGLIEQKLFKFEIAMSRLHLAVTKNFDPSFADVVANIPDENIRNLITPNMDSSVKNDYQFIRVIEGYKNVTSGFVDVSHQMLAKLKEQRKEIEDLKRINNI